MSFLRSIGRLMSGTGLKELVYAATHMLSGKAVSRSAKGVHAR
jgi:hypothetical protein